MRNAGGMAVPFDVVLEFADGSQLAMAETGRLPATMQPATSASSQRLEAMQTASVAKLIEETASMLRSTPPAPWLSRPPSEQTIAAQRGSRHHRSLDYPRCLP